VSASNTTSTVIATEMAGEVVLGSMDGCEGEVSGSRADGAVISRESGWQKRSGGTLATGRWQ
jgi:hypothetical protein